jgi:hypothetical protein
LQEQILEHFFWKALVKKSKLFCTVLGVFIRVIILGKSVTVTNLTYRLTNQIEIYNDYVRMRNPKKTLGPQRLSLRIARKM